MLLDFVGSLLVFFVIILGLAWPLVTHLDLELAEKLTVSVALSLLSIILFAWIVYIFALPLLWLWVLPLAAVTGGFLLTEWVSTRCGWLVFPIVIVLAVDSAQRSFFMPITPAIAWWRQPAFAWLQYREAREACRIPHWPDVAAAAESRQVLVTDPYSYTILTQLGAQPAPLFSPAVQFLFASDATLESSVAQLRADGMRFILISDDHLLRSRLPLYPFFIALLVTKPTLVTPMFSLYDLHAETLRPANSPGAKLLPSQ